MKKIFASALLLFSTNALAIFCPTNFSSIDFGDTMEHVIQLCGPPSSQRTFNQPIITSQEWSYFVRTRPFSQATEKMRVTFSNNRVVNINVPIDNRDICETIQIAGKSQTVCRRSRSRMNVGSTNLCGQMINIGDSTQLVQTACGQPIITNQQQDLQTSPTQITEFLYNGPPAVTLVFENGELKARK